MEAFNAAHIIEAVIGAVIIFFGWLLKNSLYGEMENIKKQARSDLDEIKGDIENIKGNCITQHNCDTQRAGCSNLLIEKIDHVNDVLRSITERQILLINRFDTHINGERK